MKDRGKDTRDKDLEMIRRGVGCGALVGGLAGAAVGALAVTLMEQEGGSAEAPARIAMVAVPVWAIIGAFAGLFIGLLVGAVCAYLKSGMEERAPMPPVGLSCSLEDKTTVPPATREAVEPMPHLPKSGLAGLAVQGAIVGGFVARGLGAQWSRLRTLNDPTLIHLHHASHWATVNMCAVVGAIVGFLVGIYAGRRTADNPEARTRWQGGLWGAALGGGAGMYAGALLEGISGADVGSFSLYVGVVGVLLGTLLGRNPQVVRSVKSVVESYIKSWRS